MKVMVIYPVLLFCVVVIDGKPHNFTDNNVPENEEPSMRDVLGMVYEDVDVLKTKTGHHDHQLDILQRDVIGLGHTMEEQSLILEKITNFMEYEGLILEDQENEVPDHQDNHDTNIDEHSIYNGEDPGYYNSELHPPDDEDTQPTYYYEEEEELNPDKHEPEGQEQEHNNDDTSDLYDY